MTNVKNPTEKGRRKKTLELLNDKITQLSFLKEATFSASCIGKALWPPLF